MTQATQDSQNSTHTQGIQAQRSAKTWFGVSIAVLACIYVVAARWVMSPGMNAQNTQNASDNVFDNTSEALPALQQDASICHVPSEQCRSVELAATPEARAQGLMRRTQLEEQTGMLFVFDQAGNYSFWMKNTKIPLGIIWIDEELQTVDRDTMQPCTQDPCPSYDHQGSARFVLEISAEEMSELTLSRGDEWDIIDIQE